MVLASVIGATSLLAKGEHTSIVGALLTGVIGIGHLLAKATGGIAHDARARASAQLFWVSVLILVVGLCMIVVAVLR